MTTRVRTAQIQLLEVDSTATGATNNWALGLGGGDGTVLWHGAADLQVTGLANGVAGQRVTIKNTGTKSATFAHNSGSSSAGNKLWNFATSAPTPVAPKGTITYEYDGTQWQIVSHHQGDTIDVAYSAGNFTASVGTWGVDAGDQATYSYKLVGDMMILSWSIVLTTLTNAAILSIAIPGGFVATRDTYGSQRAGDAGAATVLGLCRVLAGGTVLQVFPNASGGTWTATAVNQTSTEGWLAFRVN